MGQLESNLHVSSQVNFLVYIIEQCTVSEKQQNSGREICSERQQSLTSMYREDHRG